jgi:heat shock protein HtpX
MTLTSYFKGDKIALATSRARLVTRDEQPQLLNVVEEMAIASGNPVPAVYIIDDSAPNAFATGRKPQLSSIAVTQGLLDKMNRDELQGVIAHEMSHVRNYDILFATLVGVMVGAIALMADFFLRFTFFGGGRRSSNNNNGALGAIMLVVALVLAILAPIAARMVQLAISRKREYLADASAVELTRNPEGLANALEKISGDEEVLEVANRATAHLYIAQPIKKFEKRSRGLFDTHPPIQERIAVLRAMASGAASVPE